MIFGQPVLISIEGNLAVGKSTLISAIQQFYGEDCVTAAEPVSLWTNYHSTLSARNQVIRWGTALPRFNMLEQCFLNPSKFAFPMCIDFNEF